MFMSRSERPLPAGAAGSGRSNGASGGIPCSGRWETTNTDGKAWRLSVELIGQPHLAYQCLISETNISMPVATGTRGPCDATLRQAASL
jgi:hypothetical protein